MAYICGHTHNYSLTWIDGVWQLDAGHARGLGDTGAPSTFVLLQVSGAQITYRTYRDDSSGGAYSLRHAGALAGPVVFLPLLLR
jgi:predicted phosphodiesterase